MQFSSGALQLTDVMNKMSSEITSITTSFLETKELTQEAVHGCQSGSG